MSNMRNLINLIEAIDMSGSFSLKRKFIGDFTKMIQDIYARTINHLSVDDYLINPNWRPNHQQFDQDQQQVRFHLHNELIDLLKSYYAKLGSQTNIDVDYYYIGTGSAYWDANNRTIFINEEYLDLLTRWTTALFHKHFGTTQKKIGDFDLPNGIKEFIQSLFNKFVHEIVHVHQDERSGFNPNAYRSYDEPDQQKFIAMIDKAFQNGLANHPDAERAYHSSPQEIEAYAVEIALSIIDELSTQLSNNPTQTEVLDYIKFLELMITTDVQNLVKNIIPIYSGTNLPKIAFKRFFKKLVVAIKNIIAHLKSTVDQYPQS